MNNKIEKQNKHPGLVPLREWVTILTYLDHVLPNVQVRVLPPSREEATTMQNTETSLLEYRSTKY